MLKVINLARGASFIEVLWFYLFCLRKEQEFIQWWYHVELVGNFHCWEKMAAGSFSSWGKMAVESFSLENSPPNKTLKVPKMDVPQDLEINYYGMD